MKMKRRTPLMCTVSLMCISRVRQAGRCSSCSMRPILCTQEFQNSNETGTPRPNTYNSVHRLPPTTAVDTETNQRRSGVMVEVPACSAAPSSRGRQKMAAQATPTAATSEVLLLLCSCCADSLETTQITAHTAAASNYQHTMTHRATKHTSCSGRWSFLSLRY